MVLDCLFHQSSRFKKSVKKSKHHVGLCISTIKKVLYLTPDYGVSIPKFQKLRKMRVHVPHARLGKRGGYRLIYRKVEIDQMIYIYFADLYFKGDCEDLSDREYRVLFEESELAIGNKEATDWEIFKVASKAP